MFIHTNNDSNTRRLLTHIENELKKKFLASGYRYTGIFFWCKKIMFSNLCPPISMVADCVIFAVTKSNVAPRGSKFNGVSVVVVAAAAVVIVVRLMTNLIY